MVDGFVATTIESFLTIVTVTTVRIMTTVDTNSATDETRQLIELHVETTLSSVQVTLTRWQQTHKTSRN